MKNHKSTKLLSLLLSFLLVITSVSVALTVSSVDYWDGTADISWYSADSTRFTVSTASQFAGIGKLVREQNITFEGCVISLANDIILSDLEAASPIGWTPAEGNEVYFMGTVNGNGHKIDGLYISQSTSYAGFFTKMSHATFENLTVKCSVKGADCTGAFAGYADHCTFVNCTVSGTVSGAGKVGGFVGNSAACEFKNCKNEANVTATGQNAGGFAGVNYRDTFTCCENKGHIKGAGNIGGISGNAISNASISALFEACRNTGNVEANTSTYAKTVGGITGYAQGDSANEKTLIYDCINTGTTSSALTGGGIVGTCAGYTQLSCCISTGKSAKGIANTVSSSTGVSADNCLTTLNVAEAISSGITKNVSTDNINKPGYSGYNNFGQYVDAADLAENPRNVWYLTTSGPLFYNEYQDNCEHIYNAEPDETVAATCVADGYNRFICTKCGYVNDVVIPATGEHIFDIVTKRVEADCANDGYIDYKCNTCEETKHEVLTATGIHSYEYISDENCLKCSVCLKTITSVSGSCGENATWTFNVSGGNNVLTISGEGAVEDRSADSDWLDYLPYVKSIAFSGTGITAIGKGAFANCAALESVTLPSSLETIDEGAFKTTGLTTVTIPGSVTTVGANAFAQCEKLSAVNFDSKGKSSVDTTVVSSSPNATVYAYCSASFYTALKTAGVRISSRGEHDYADATCTKPATCKICSATTGDTKPHAFTVPVYYSADQHTYKCEVCGRFSEEKYEDHTCTGNVPCGSAPVCDVCGESYGDIVEHIYEQKTDETNHWKQCKLCNDIVETAPHSGGTATCIKKAVCTGCGAEYGDTTAHDLSVVEISDDKTQHRKVCSVAGCTEATEWADHSGGTATCINRAVCSVCNTAYGELDSNNHGTYSLILDQESVKKETCTEDGFTGNKVCSACKAIREAGSAITAPGHEGGTATCTALAVCITCGTAYGEYADCVMNEAAWETDGTYHWHGCTNPDCDKTSEKIAHNDGQNGATATCKVQAKCADCGEYYGALSTTNHTGGTKTVNLKDATCTEKGYTGDTICKGCGATLATGEITEKAEHTGGFATCCEKGKCEVCGTEYIDYNTSYHTGGEKTDETTAVTASCSKEGYTGDILCAGCNAKLRNGKTTAKLNHTVGTPATCKAAAVCAICHETYGNVNPNNHTGTTHLENKVEASCGVEGYTGDEVYDCCGKVAVPGTASPALEHTLSATKGSNDIASWTVSACSKCSYATCTVKLHTLYGDGTPLAGKGFKLGNTALTSDANGYVSTSDILDRNTYTLRSDDGLYTATITINADNALTINVDAKTPEAPTQPTEAPTSDSGDNGSTQKRRSLWDLIVEFFMKIKRFVDKILDTFKK